MKTISITKLSFKSTTLLLITTLLSVGVGIFFQLHQPLSRVLGEATANLLLEVTDEDTQIPFTSQGNGVYVSNAASITITLTPGSVTSSGLADVYSHLQVKDNKNLLNYILPTVGGDTVNGRVYQGSAYKVRVKIVGNNAAVPTSVQCTSNPVCPLPGYKWLADCLGNSCFSNSDCDSQKNSSDPKVNPETSYWCFGFSDGFRCMKLVSDPNPSTSCPAAYKTTITVGGVGVIVTDDNGAPLEKQNGVYITKTPIIHLGLSHQ